MMEERIALEAIRAAEDASLQAEEALQRAEADREAAWQAVAEHNEAVAKHEEAMARRASMQSEGSFGATCMEMPFSGVLEEEHLNSRELGYVIKASQLLVPWAMQHVLVG